MQPPTVRLPSIRTDKRPGVAWLYTSHEPETPTSWSRDGRYLLFHSVGPKTNADLWVLPMQGEAKPRSILQTPFGEWNGMFSPDSRWIAYTSDESGNAIFVRPFSLEAGAGATGAKRMVSTGTGGFVPGPTSHDVVARVRRALRERRVGHTGTLDPLATRTGRWRSARRSTKGDSTRRRRRPAFDRFPCRTRAPVGGRLAISHQRDQAGCVGLFDGVRQTDLAEQRAAKAGLSGRRRVGTEARDVADAQTHLLVVAHEKGVPGKVVAQLMGHAKVDTTLNVYTQVIDGVLRTAVDKVGSELVRYCSQTGGGFGAHPLILLVLKVGSPHWTISATG